MSHEILLSDDIPDDPGGYLAVGGFARRIQELEAENTRLRAAMKNAEEDLQRGYHASAAAILRVALEPKS